MRLLVASVRAPFNFVLLGSIAALASAEYVSVCPEDKNPRSDQDVFRVKGPLGVARFIDITGKVVLESEAIEGDFFEGLARASGEQLVGFMDKASKWRIPPRFDVVGDFSEGLAAVKIGAEWGYIDATGTVVIPPAYDEAREFHERRAAVRRPGQAGPVRPNLVSIRPKSGIGSQQVNRIRAMLKSPVDVVSHSLRHTSRTRLG